MNREVAATTAILDHPKEVKRNDTILGDIASL